MSAEPLVTVVIPSYNHARYVTQAIQSIFDQTYKNWELIIIDDASKDRSQELLQSLPQVRDPRVRLVLSSENAGMSRRLNEAVAMARGDFFSWCNSDDWYLPNKLAVEVEAFRSLGPDYGVVYANGYRYFEDVKVQTEFRTQDPPTGEVLLPLLERQFVYAITPLVRTECLRRFPWFEELIVEGEGVLMRIAMRYKFAYVDEFVAVMRAHSYNIGANLERQHRDVPAMFKKIFAHPDLPPQYRVHEGRILSKYYRNMAWSAVRVNADRTIWFRCLRNGFTSHISATLKDPRTYLAIPLMLIPRRALVALNSFVTERRVLKAARGAVATSDRAPAASVGSGR